MRTPAPIAALIVVLFFSYPSQAQEEFELSISDAAGAVGGTATVEVSLSHDASDIRGFHFGICHDPDLVSINEEDIVDGEGLSSASVEFQSIEVYDDGWTLDSLWCVPCDSVMMPSGDWSIYEATYELLDAGVASLDFCEDLGDPAVTNRIVDIDGNDEIEPTTVSGSIAISHTFLRGDVDGNGDVSAISDALALLEWAFTGGSRPDCDDAADVDDSGHVSGLIDAIYLLRWGFQDGQDPPAPGVETCGPDETADELGCSEAPDGCE